MAATNLATNIALLHNLVGSLQRGQQQQQQRGLTNTPVEPRSLINSSVSVTPQQNSLSPAQSQKQQEISSVTATNKTDTCILPIKVFNPEKKRDSKVFMLKLKLDEVSTLKCLQEEILITVREETC